MHLVLETGLVYPLPSSGTDTKLLEEIIRDAQCLFHKEQCVGRRSLSFQSSVNIANRFMLLLQYVFVVTE